MSAVRAGALSQDREHPVEHGLRGNFGQTVVPAAAGTLAARADRPLGDKGVFLLVVGRPAVGCGPQEGAVEADHSRPEGVGQMQGAGGVAHQDVRLSEERRELDEVKAARQTQNAARSRGPDDFGQGLLLGGTGHENRVSCSGEQAGQLCEAVRRPGQRRSAGSGMKDCHGTALVQS